MKLKHQCFLLFVSLAIFSNYGQESKTDDQLYGVWNSIGYGMQLEIAKKTTILRDIYASGCNVNTKLPTAYLEEFYTITKLTKDSLQIKEGFTRYDFVRSKTSEGCKKSKDNPLSNFDALWETFNENYVFFELREVNWNTLRDKYRKRLSKKSTDLELYNVLDEMISELNDGHVSLDMPDALEEKLDDNDEEDLDNLREKVISTINNKYIPKHKTYNNGKINWGLITDEISYVQFNDFFTLANYDIASDLSSKDFTNQYWKKAEESESYTKDVLASFKKQMKLIYNDIKNTKTCIIDVRFNGGGFDQIGLEILSYFTNEKTIAFSKKARFGKGFTKPQTIYTEPNGMNYKGNLYILTSPETASAAETFVIASQNIENVYRVGSNTEGVLSDVLSKELPNGWEYGLSNEIYENADGKCYEKMGIPSDYLLEYTRNTKGFYENLWLELKTNDNAIEKVLDLHK